MSTKTLLTNAIAYSFRHIDVALLTKSWKTASYPYKWYFESCHCFIYL